MTLPDRGPDLGPDLAPTRSMLGFVAASPSPFHAVATAAGLLDAAGFTRLDESATWPAGHGGRYVVRGGALVAWWTRCDGGDADPAAPLRIVGAHTDSPNLRLKPHPDTGAMGWRQVAVEVYGSPLVNSWLDRDLGLSGRLVLRSGDTIVVRIDRPLLRVAQLAIHLDRDVNDRGLLLDRQQHLTPLWGLGSPRDGEVVEVVAAAADVDPGEIAAFDLMMHDLTPPALLGVDEEFVASARLDNLCSSWAAIDALLASVRGEGPSGPVLAALFDHEEVGSESTSGAAGPLLATVVERLFESAGSSAEDRHRALAGSICVSADMAHAVHPNYPERHEPGHRPLPNGGPVVKVNANQRYATDAVSAAAFTSACDKAAVPWQVFVGRNNMPCGSTIGPLTATRLGIATVDVGCAQLSMHSARELCGAHDPGYLAAALTAFYRG